MSPARPSTEDAFALARDAGAVRQTHGPAVQHHVSPTGADLAGSAGIDGTVVQGQRIRRDGHLADVGRRID